MMVGGVRYLNRNIKKYDAPVLLLHGEADKIVPVEFSKRLYELLPVEDKKLITYPDAYHEILNDLDQEKVRKDIISWLDQKVKELKAK
jgi:alpha-beta hydrolase superfamily lysophospholipase